MTYNHNRKEEEEKGRKRVKYINYQTVQNVSWTVHVFFIFLTTFSPQVISTPPAWRWVALTLSDSLNSLTLLLPLLPLTTLNFLPFYHSGNSQHLIPQPIPDSPRLSFRPHPNRYTRTSTTLLPNSLVATPSTSTFRLDIILNIPPIGIDSDLTCRHFYTRSRWSFPVCGAWQS